MLKIAICDDTLTELTQVIAYINDYNHLQSDSRKISYTAFQSALELIAAMENGYLFDLVILDILMPHLTGMEAAKEIRAFNKEIKIIFSTASREFAVDSYAVNAYYYLLKPLWKDKFFILLDRIISEVELQNGESILVKSKTGLTRIYMRRLEFVEITGRNVHYHMVDGVVYEAIGTLSELELALQPFTYFIRTHRSYLVNLNHVDTLKSGQINMRSTTQVPLSKSNYSIVYDKYISFILNNPNV